jgi:DNA-binding MarR family transcriptional regulator
MAEQHYQPHTYLARDSVGYLVRRLYTLLLARFEGTLARADFTLTQWIVLIQLRDGCARTAADIASDLQHDSGALTRVLDQLERRGYLARKRSTRDRRVVELRLTRAGHRIVEELVPLVVDETNAALAPLSHEEFLQLRDYLQRLLAHAQRTATDTPPAAGTGAAPRGQAAAAGPASRTGARPRAKPRRVRVRS